MNVFHFNVSWLGSGFCQGLIFAGLFSDNVFNGVIETDDRINEIRRISTLVLLLFLVSVTHLALIRSWSLRAEPCR